MGALAIERSAFKTRSKQLKPLLKVMASISFLRADCGRWDRGEIVYTVRRRCSRRRSTRPKFVRAKRSFDSCSETDINVVENINLNYNEKHTRRSHSKLGD